MRTALFAVGVVWLLGCVWSYQEQSAFAADKGFGFPHLLPLVIDGFAVSMAGVAWAASLDARPAVAARLATLLAVAASAASNGAWAWLRTDHDLAAVTLAVAVPVAANLAFEVLLAELRRQVQRRRGLPAPVALPPLRVIRLVLAPAATFGAWRALVLDLTAFPDTRSADVRECRAEVVSRSWRGRPELSDAVSSENTPDTGSGGQESDMTTTTDLAPAPGARVRDARVLELVALLEDGHAVTGPQAAVLFRVSDRTGRRLIAAAQDVLDTPPAGPARSRQLTLTSVGGA